MIKKYWFELLLFEIFVLLLGILIGVIIKNVDYSDKIKHLENEVVEAYDKGYSDGENHALIDLMEDYYDVLIENAILKERIKWLEKTNPNIEQILDDFESLVELQQHYYQAKIISHSFGDWIQILDDLELVIELQQYYYQENITSHSFGGWLQINYPALYERVLNYY